MLNCILFCQFYVNLEGQWFLVNQEVSNKWIFICIAFDLLNQEISIRITAEIVFFHKLESTQIRAPYHVRYVNIWWEDKYRNIKFPDKFTLLYIHSNEKTVDTFKCGEPGDIYSWKVEGWNSSIKEQNHTPLISQETTYQACQLNYQVYALPRLNMYDSVDLCKKINGQMYYENPSYQEMVKIEGYRKTNNWEAIRPFWIPYTDEKDEGVFRNIYSEIDIFRNISEYFTPGQPNGGRNDNCLQYSSKLLYDVNCVSDYSFSLAKIAKSASYLVLRGLCSKSQVERFYTSGNNHGKFIWKGHNYASIQYIDRWLLYSILDNVWGESLSPYESLLIGTHEWVVHNDKKCSNDIYTANLSLRFDIILLYINFMAFIMIYISLCLIDI